MYLLFYIDLVSENIFFYSNVPKNSISVIKSKTEFRDSRGNLVDEILNSCIS